MYPWRDNLLGDSNRSVRVVVPPIDEPITLAEARLHLRVDPYVQASGDSPSITSHPDDPLILELITASREWAETYSGRALAPQTLELVLDSFPVPHAWLPAWRFQPWMSKQAIELPRPPIIAVESVSYLDGEGFLTDLDLLSYEADVYSEPGRLYTAFGTFWPMAQPSANAVRIRYRAGYSAQSESPDAPVIPASVKAAIKLVLAHLYRNREATSEVRLDEMPLGAAALLDSYRVRLGVA